MKKEDRLFRPGLRKVRSSHPRDREAFMHPLDRRPPHACHPGGLNLYPPQYTGPDFPLEISQGYYYPLDHGYPSQRYPYTPHPVMENGYPGGDLRWYPPSLVSRGRIPHLPPLAQRYGREGHVYGSLPPHYPGPPFSHHPPAPAMSYPHPSFGTDPYFYNHSLRGGVGGGGGHPCDARPPCQDIASAAPGCHQAHHDLCSGQCCRSHVGSRPTTGSVARHSRGGSDNPRHPWSKKTRSYESINRGPTYSAPCDHSCHTSRSQHCQWEAGSGWHDCYPDRAYASDTACRKNARSFPGCYHYGSSSGPRSDLECFWHTGYTDPSVGHYPYHTHGCYPTTATYFGTGRGNSGRKARSPKPKTRKPLSASNKKTL